VQAIPAASQPPTPVASPAPSRRTRKKLDERRLELRDAVFPGHGDNIWSRKTHDGWTTVPRLLPLIMALIKQLSTPGDASAAYFELWGRVYDEGLVTINHEAECAYAAGYTGSRAIRTWRERMQALESLGFINSVTTGNRMFAQILIVDPILIAVQLRNKPRTRVPDEWWSAFVARALEVGAQIPAVE
jgi:hypothetical protein